MAQDITQSLAEMGLNLPSDAITRLATKGPLTVGEFLQLHKDLQKTSSDPNVQLYTLLKKIDSTNSTVYTGVTFKPNKIKDKVCHLKNTLRGKTGDTRERFLKKLFTLKAPDPPPRTGL